MVTLITIEVYLRIEVIEEGDEIEPELHPSFSVGLLQFFVVENRGGVVDSGLAHHGTVEVTKTERLAKVNLIIQFLIVKYSTVTL